MVSCCSQASVLVQAPESSASELCCIATHSGAVKLCRKRPGMGWICCILDAAPYFLHTLLQMMRKIPQHHPKKRKHTIPLLWNEGNDCLIVFPCSIENHLKTKETQMEQLVELAKARCWSHGGYHFNGTTKTLETGSHGETVISSQVLRDFFSIHTFWGQKALFWLRKKTVQIWAFTHLIWFSKRWSFFKQKTHLLSCRLWTSFSAFDKNGLFFEIHGFNSFPFVWETSQGKFLTTRPDPPVVA